MVLLLCLIFLTALTLLGLSASAEAILQNQLAANLQETERARQSARAALSSAETWLLELEGPAPEICSTSCASLKLHAQGGLPSNPESENLSWWMSHGHEAGLDPLTGERISTISNGSIHPPVWIIEVIHEIPATQDGTTELQTWYRILARGNGQTSAGISVIESIVVRSWADTESAESSGTGFSGLCPGSEPTADCGRVAWRELR